MFAARIIQEARLTTVPLCAFVIFIATGVAWVQVTPKPTDLPTGDTAFTYQTLAPTKATGGVQTNYPFGGSALGWSGIKCHNRACPIDHSWFGVRRSVMDIGADSPVASRSWQSNHRTKALLPVAKP